MDRLGAQSDLDRVEPSLLELSHHALLWLHQYGGNLDIWNTYLRAVELGFILVLGDGPQLAANIIWLLRGHLLPHQV